MTRYALLGLICVATGIVANTFMVLTWASGPSLVRSDDPAMRTIRGYGCFVLKDEWCDDTVWVSACYRKTCEMISEDPEIWACPQAKEVLPYNDPKNYSEELDNTKSGKEGPPTTKNAWCYIETGCAVQTNGAGCDLAGNDGIWRCRPVPGSTVLTGIYLREYLGKDCGTGSGP